MIEKTAIDRLIEHWSDFGESVGTDRLHDKDVAMRQRRCSLISSPTLHAFLNGPVESKDVFHLALSPVPYVGDLRNADIFLLMLNPSLGVADYATDQDQRFQNILNKTRRQELTNESHPCFALNPDLWWSSWFSYYEELFRDALLNHAGTTIPYATALQQLAKRLVILELVPYYSAKSYQISPAFAKSLCSAKLAMAAAKQIVKRADEGTATVILRWGAIKWDLPASDQVKRPTSTFEFKSCGRAIVERLKLPYLTS